VGIPEPWGSRLDSHRATAGDPLAHLIPAHLTLLGPTPVDPSEATLARIDEHLTEVAARHDTFRLHLRGAGTFRPVTQVVFVAIAAGGDECTRLAADIRSGPLARPLLFPYHPHVTVAHDVSTEALDTICTDLANFDAAFRVDGFTLYQHGPDSRWHPHRHFALQFPY
jgi:2'-5' RNA ligase